MLPTLCIENPLWTQFLTLSLEGQKIDLKHKIQKGLNLMESRKEGDYSYTLCKMGLTNLDFPAHFYVNLYVCTTITAFCQNVKPREHK